MTNRNKYSVKSGELRLKCWKAINGWGVSEDGLPHENWGWEERMKRANELFKWSVGKYKDDK